MHIACIGGGPAGLYLGILVKRVAPAHRVTVYERNRPDDTFGFGVVFSDATLDNLATADPESYEEIARQFARWEDIEIHVGGEVLRSTGHGFCGLERKQLNLILAERARALGVELAFEREVTLDEVRGADVVVAADGVTSAIRTQLAEHFAPAIDVRPNKFVWLGSTVPYSRFTFLFKDTPHGLFRVHAYRYHRDGSTFIVECTADTWKRAGFKDADEDQTIAILSEIFAAELAGHRLIKNRSIWRNFPTVRCRSWRHGNVVLVGDAAHTAHFSIGSGTKLAMEDAIALRDALLEAPTVEQALASYEARRRPEVEALQAAAQASLEWFEGTERYTKLAPPQFVYNLLTRSLRVSHASVAKRDPELARTVEIGLASAAGVAMSPPPPPLFLPCKLGGLSLTNRVALAPWRVGGAVGGVVGDGHLVFLASRAAGGIGLVMSEPLGVSGPGSDGAGLADDEQAVAWRRIVEFVHGSSKAKMGALLAWPASGDAARLLADAARRAAFAGFDLACLDLAGATSGREAMAAAIRAVRAAWPSDRPLGVRIGDGLERGDIAAMIAAGAGLAWVAPPRAGAEGGGRLPAAPLADRIRNELGVPTVVEGAVASASDIDAVIAAGRCDLVALDRALVEDAGFAQRVAQAVGYPMAGGRG